jgi:acyl carrier protein
METVAGDKAGSRADRAGREPKFIAIVGDLARELHPRHAPFETISASSRLERDLGIDSLGRTELVLRLKRAFGLRLSIKLVGDANTVDDFS